MAHFSVKQRRPFKNSFCPSRAAQAADWHLGVLPTSISLPKTLKISSHGRRFHQNAAALRRTAAVVRNRGDVADQTMCSPRQPAHARQIRVRNRDLSRELPRSSSHTGRAPPRAASEACCAAYGVPLREPFEADRSRRGPANDRGIRVRDGNLRVVERRGHVDYAVRDDAALALLLEFFFCASLPLPVFPGATAASGAGVFFAALLARFHSIPYDADS